MAATAEMAGIARKLKPHAACIVPERRQERTTEGGLDVAGQRESLRGVVGELAGAGIRVSLFIAADPAQIEAAAGHRRAGDRDSYRRLVRRDRRRRRRGRRGRIRAHPSRRYACEERRRSKSMPATASISSPRKRSRRSTQIAELNIGHFLIGEAIFSGLGAAVRSDACVHGPRQSHAMARALGPSFMILGIGSDITDVRRIAKVIERHGDRFLDRVFTPIERTKADKRRNRVETYAKRFAAKEACAKALGTGLRAGVWWRDMGVVNLPARPADHGTDRRRQAPPAKNHTRGLRGRGSISPSPTRDRWRMPSW